MRDFFGIVRGEEVAVVDVLAPGDLRFSILGQYSAAQARRKVGKRESGERSESAPE